MRIMQTPNGLAEAQAQAESAWKEYTKAQEAYSLARKTHLRAERVFDRAFTASESAREAYNRAAQALQDHQAGRHPGLGAAYNQEG